MADWDDLAASCHQRFERLQALRRQEGLDALLIAIGPDAAFSRANEAVFNWLMLGLSGREALSSVSGQYEESLVCLGPRSLIFCKKGDFEDLSLRTARWEQCFLVAPEENDQERYEEKKIGTFIEMVKDCRKLGVFASQSEIHQELKMAIEKWPVVQAFGYDEYGLGFLTLNRELMNLEPQMRQIFSAWDLTAMHWAKQTLPKLHKAWTDALLFHDQHSREEALAAAPIVDYFIYGRLDDEVQTAISPSPRLLVGKHTSQILTPAVPEEVTVMDEDGARQMIWEAVDPITGVALTRTYGLTTPFDPKMKEVLFTYAACCRCCRVLLRENVDPKQAARRATEIFQKEGITQAPEVFDCHIDAFGVSHAAESRPGLCLRFLRVACRLPDATLVAYGDSSFGDGTALGESSTVPSWAFLPAPSEEARSLEVKNSLETAMGLKLDWGRSVALGHRKDVRVYLDPPEQPPDVLELGEEPIDVEAFCELAVADASGDGESGVCGYAAGSAWSYASGKVVVSTGRSGYLVLKCKGSTSSLPASKGQLWVSMEAEPPVPWLRVALSVSPNALSTWRQELPSSAGDAELSWIESGTSSAVVAPAPPRPATADEGRKQKQLLVTGLPGCGAIDVAKALARLLHAPCADLPEDLDTGSLWTHIQRMQGEEEWLVVCDVLRDPSQLQAQLPQLRVLSVLDPAIAYPWQTVRHPLLHRQTPPNALVAIGRQKETQDHRALSNLLAKEQQQNIGRQVLLRPLTGELLEAVRAVPAPVLNRVPHTTGPSVFRCFVPCGVLDLHLLRSRLSACLDEAAEQFCKPPLAKASPWKGLFCVEVKALTVESSDSFWSKGDVDLSSSSSSLVEKNLVLTSKGELARTQWQEPLASKHGVLFWFCDLSGRGELGRSSPANWATEEVANCAVQELKEEAPWDLQTIPEDVRLKVAHDLRQEGAPEGYSFDGHRYINQEDYSSQRDHPFLAQRLTQLASEHNAAQASRCHRAREVLASPPFTRPMSPTGRPSAGRPPSRSGYPQ